MPRLNFADRCAIFVVQIIAFTGMLAGAVSWINNGFSVGALVFIGSGGLVTVVILLGLIDSRGSGSSTSSSSGAEADPPPKYRLTWRKEFLQSIPDDLKADLEKDLQLKGKKGKRRRKDNHRQVIWTSDIEAGVHRISSVGGLQGRDMFSSMSDHRVSAADGRPSNDGDPPMEIVHLESPSGAVSSQRHSSYSAALFHLATSSSSSFPSGHGSSAPSSVSLGHGRRQPVTNGNANDGLPSYDEAKMWF